MRVNVRERVQPNCRSPPPHACSCAAFSSRAVLRSAKSARSRHSLWHSVRSVSVGPGAALWQILRRLIYLRVRVFSGQGENFAENLNKVVLGGKALFGGSAFDSLQFSNPYVRGLLRASLESLLSCIFIGTLSNLC